MLTPTALPLSPSMVHLQRIQHISRMMVWACWALLVLAPLALAAYWSQASASALAVQGNLLPSNIMQPLHDWQRIAGACVTAVPMVLSLLGVWQAKLCFAQFAQGVVFSAEAVGFLRRFAGWIAIAALAAIVASAATSALLTLHNPVGLRYVALGVSSHNVVTLFFAAVVWWMAAVMGQGQSLAEENAHFI
jgi:hypothetical protein